VTFPKDHDENFRSKRIHKKSARWKSGVRRIIIAVSFLVAAIISFTVFYSFQDGYENLPLIGFILFLIANIIFINSMFRKVDGYKKIMSKKKLLGIMILGTMALTMIPIIVYHGVYSVYYPEQYAERELKDEYKREQIRISQQIQEQQKEIEKQNTQSITQAKTNEFEKYCTGVDSTDLDLYGNKGLLCSTFIYSGYLDWCYTQTSTEQNAKDCVDEIDRRIIRECRGSDELGYFLDVPEDVCQMYTMKEIYHKLMRDLGK